MKILLGVPHNGTVIWKTSQSAWRCSSEHEVQVADLPSSLLALSFNSLYADALNRNEEDGSVDLFAMLHSDLAPDGFWIDTLVRILTERDADLVSAINAIKDGRGLTSSGVALPGQSWRPYRRFTMKELLQYPATFNAQDAGYGDATLLHNTGCWVADLRKPIFHEEDENGCLKAFFTINDRIVRKGKERRWVAEVEPEDWFFSRKLHDLGADTYVTREVVTHHYGLSEIDNQTERGQELDDEVMALWEQDFKECMCASA
jgi:hypothetical protein